MTSSAPKARFHWDDPFLLEAQLIDDERMVHDAANAYCQWRFATHEVERVDSDYRSMMTDCVRQLHGGGLVRDDFVLVRAHASMRTLRFLDESDEVHRNASAKVALARRTDDV